MLELVGLTSVGGRRVKTYSLGMRQRLGLAGVMLGDPHTVVLDEPANGLDPEGIRWIRDVLVHLASQGRTVLVSSHLLSEMAQMANDLVVIGQGRLIEQCTVAEFVERHAERWVRVKSPGIATLVQAAAAQGAQASMIDPVTAELRGITSAEVGELAARSGIVLHELSPQTGSLEDAFLQATATAQEFAAQPVVNVMINTIRSEWIKLRTVRMNFVLFILAVAFPVIVSVLVASLADINDLKVTDVAGSVTGIVGRHRVAAGRGRRCVDQRRVRATAPSVRRSRRRRKRMRVLDRQGHRHGAVRRRRRGARRRLLLRRCRRPSPRHEARQLSLSDDPRPVPALIGIVVFAVIVSLLGFGIGMVIRNTPAAVAVLILWPLVVENIIMAILSAAGVDNPQKFLPYISGFGLGNPDAPIIRQPQPRGRWSVLRRGDRGGRDRSAR